MDSTLADHAHILSEIVARGVFWTPTLYPAKIHLLEQLVFMKFKSSSVNLAPVLFIQRTGGDKSLVQDVHSVLLCGVSFNIVPIVPLGADQKRKVL